MGFNNGTFERDYNWVDDDANDIGIEAVRMDGEFDNYANGLSTCILKDGSQTITADIPFANKKITGLKDATAGTDAANLKVIQNRVGVHGTSSGTDTITLTLSPAITAYVIGQEFTFKAGGTNTGAATININTVGAKDIKLPDGTALNAGMITTDKFYKIRYDGTNFVLLDEIPINILTEKETLVDDDVIGGEDSANSFSRISILMSSVWNYIKSKIYTQSAFTAYLSTTEENVLGGSTSATYFHTVVFDEVISDINGDYNNTTGEFNTPKDGLYQLNTAAVFEGLGDNNTFCNLGVVVAGRDTRFFSTGNWGAMRTTSANPNVFGVNGSIILKLDEGDSVRIRPQVRGTSQVVDVQGSVGTNFSMSLIREL